MKMRFSLLLLVLVAAPSLAQNKTSGHIQRINPPALSTPRGYTHVVVARGARTIYLAGQVALDKEGKLVGAGDLEAQARQVFENLKSALAAAGGSFADLVKITIYVTDASQIEKLRAVRNQYITQDYPASTFVEVKALFRPDVLIEV